MSPDKNNDQRCRLYLITPPALDPDAFADTLAAALDAGDVGCLQLRLKDADDAAVRSASQILMPVCHARDVASWPACVALDRDTPKADRNEDDRWVRLANPRRSANPMVRP